MAKINKIEIKTDALSDAFAFSAGAAAQTVPAGMDDKFMLMIQNTSSTVDAALTIKAGDGVRASIGDLAVTVAKSTTAAISLDSSRFKKLSGADMGTFDVRITSASPEAVKLLAVLL